MSPFDPDLRPEACAACGQQVVKAAGACPVCATKAELAKGSRRPVVAPGPWPRLVLARGTLAGRAGAVSEVRLTGPVLIGGRTDGHLPDLDLGAGEGPVLLLEPEGDGVRATALGAGASAGGAPLQGTRGLPRGTALALPGGREGALL